MGFSQALCNVKNVLFDGYVEQSYNIECNKNVFTDVTLSQIKLLIIVQSYNNEYDI